MAQPNAVYRIAKNAEIVPFVYRYDEFFGPFLFEFHRNFYAKQSHKPILFDDVVRYMMRYDDSIGAFNDNNISVNVIFPDHEEDLWIDHHAMMDTAPEKSVYVPYDDIIYGYHEQIPVGFMRTELVSIAARVIPWKIYKDAETGEFNRKYPGIEWALPDPPMTLFVEMNERDMDYAWIDARNNKPVFGKDNTWNQPPKYLDNGNQQYVSMLVN